MASTYTIAANALNTIIASTFPGVTVVHDKLHEAVGYKGARIGVAPIREVPNARHKIAKEAWIEIRYLDVWKRDVDPLQQVDPRTIANKAEQLAVAIRDAVVTKSGDMWFFDVELIDYPQDPTGNHSRFYMTVRAWGNNSAIIETTG